MRYAYKTAQNWWLASELQKDFFRLVSWFSTKKCPKYVSSEFGHNMTNDIEKCQFSSQVYAFGVELSYKFTVLKPFYAKYAKNCSNYLKMSGFFSRNVRYPRYQDTDFLEKKWQLQVAEEGKQILKDMLTLLPTAYWFPPN